MDTPSVDSDPSLDSDPGHDDPSLDGPGRDAIPVGDTGDEIVCPMPCDWCDALGSGACEDCLDCLLWPEVPPGRSAAIPAQPGPTTPTMTAQLRERRASLDVGTRVGLVSRRFRRGRHLSQRGLAAALGWSRTSVNRAEQDAAPLPLRRVETLLRHLGFRLAIVPVDPVDPADPADPVDPVDPATVLGEDRDEAWGASDLLARDSAGRHLPPYGEVTWNSIIDRRMNSRVLGHEAEWTWQRRGSWPEQRRGSWPGQEVS